MVYYNLISRLSGFKGQISLFWVLAARTYVFPSQSLSELMISGSQSSRPRFLHSETWLLEHTFSLYKVYPNWWFLALRLQGPDFSILRRGSGHTSSLHKIHPNWCFLALRPHGLILRRGSQDINFPFTKSIRIHDFWLSGFKGQISLFWDVAPRTHHALVFTSPGRT